MDDELVELNPRIVIRGLPAIRMRIGIDTAAIVRTTVMTAGEPRSMLLGDTINVASHLPSLEQPYDPGDDEPTRTTMSETVRQHVGQARPARLIGDLALKGRRLPVTAWQIFPKSRTNRAA